MMAVWSYPIGILVIPSLIKTFTLPAAAILLTMALMLWCDVELVTDAVLRMRRQAAEVPPSPPNLDWLVWIAALALSAYYFVLGVFAVRIWPQVGLFTLLLSLGFAAVMILFDVALILHSVKPRRTQ
ncbi:MAG: hypothetical protein LAO55_00290 [Acidobacteriia bacterium]|nr:hypothetical protein [Terriglobia bacterium]